MAHLLASIRQAKGDDDVKCPVCGHDDWTIGSLGEVRIYEPGRIGDKIYPVVPVFCDHCAYIMFFHGIRLRLPGFTPEEVTEASEEPSQ